MCDHLTHGATSWILRDFVCETAGENISIIIIIYVNLVCELTYYANKTYLITYVLNTVTLFRYIYMSTLRSGRAEFS